MVFKKRFRIFSRLRFDIPPTFKIINSFLMSSTNFISNQHNPMKKHLVGVIHKEIAKISAYRPITAIRNPNGVFQLNGNLNEMRHRCNFIQNTRQYFFIYFFHTQLAGVMQTTHLSYQKCNN